MVPAEAAGVREPPPEYVHSPWRLKVTVTRVGNIRAICGGPRRTVGCARKRRGVCNIYIATRTFGISIGQIRRHELAHCNGWHHRDPY